MSFMLIGFTLIVKKKIKRGIFFSIIGFFFHKTAIVFCLLYLILWAIRRFHFSAWIPCAYVAAIAFLFLGIGPIALFVIKIFPTWSGYIHSAYLTQMNLISLSKAIVPNAFIFYGLIQNKKKLSDTSSIPSLGAYLLIGAVLYGCLSLAFPGVMVLVRIAELFVFLYIGEICEIVESERGKSNFYLWLLIIIYYVVLTVVTIFIMHGNGITGYSFSFSI